LTDPFGGFGGRLFLFFCQFIETCIALLQSKPQRKPHPTGASFSTASALRQLGECSVGAICCTAVAAALIPVFSSSAIKSLLPLPFLLIIVLVAFRFGRAAGILGTLAAAFVFAYFLFEPQGLAVSDPAAREHLLWMSIAGIAVSDLLARLRAAAFTSKKF
jgi:K+-sensing histidine kinase KdpD